MQRAVFMLFAAVLFCAQAALAQTPFDISRNSQLTEIVNRKKLVVGMELKYPPFESTDAKGMPVGLDVDLARMIAKDLGVELEIKDMEWTGLIPALQTGKIDLIISGITGTLERAKTITFTSAYFTTGLCALLSSKRAPDLASVDALNDPKRVIAVKTGTTADIVASKRFPKATINRYKDESACVQEVVNGRADAFLYDQLSIARHAKEFPQATRALLKPFTYEPFCIAMRKGDFDLWNWLEMFVSLRRNDGTLEELRAKYVEPLLN
ncbi:L-cystine-binding protein FliY [Fundidesulfovibrio magnetotacticus]|uniref:L-cystine-binding protein FliY n=1 Tax=Fundidesulfovibrio magnetotacticus TaxID=2730080 RepID=A0A6V8LZZ8_9BACT|nr:transporter substrate-binding domain-containing protein [Fundidesulfovibrio magnetotacticus]GFK95589.1 L-cystine-binding protein FliY [Fundidesulfovibrio magnetotacticus]